MKAKRLNLMRRKQLEFQLSLNTQMQTSHNTLESILGPDFKYILKELQENFPQHTPHPKEELSVIMYKAGQRSVVEWIEHRLEEDK
tara:strand:- start:793 stop:1050 length:258 start_codon:yes stop_codon:yes gene_type:complete